jgi:hypothetical protein
MAIRRSYGRGFNTIDSWPPLSHDPLSAEQTSDRFLLRIVGDDIHPAWTIRDLMTEDGAAPAL